MSSIIIGIVTPALNPKDRKFNRLHRNIPSIWGPVKSRRKPLLSRVGVYSCVGVSWYAFTPLPKSSSTSPSPWPSPPDGGEGTKRIRDIWRTACGKKSDLCEARSRINCRNSMLLSWLLTYWRHLTSNSEFGRFGHIGDGPIQHGTGTGFT